MLGRNRESLLYRSTTEAKRVFLRLARFLRVLPHSPAGISIAPSAPYLYTTYIARWQNVWYPPPCIKRPKRLHIWRFCMGRGVRHVLHAYAGYQTFYHIAVFIPISLAMYSFKISPGLPLFISLLFYFIFSKSLCPHRYGLNSWRGPTTKQFLHHVTESSSSPLCPPAPDWLFRCNPPPTTSRVMIASR